ncbi:MAG: mechanosensitive ion channel family protein [Planctomycetota bacterium]
MAEITDAAEGETPDADSLFSEVPSNPDQMTEVVIESLGDMWTGLLARLPFIGIGFLALLATWVISRAAMWIARRVLLASRVRRSLRDLIMQLLSAVIWVIGLLVAIVIVFPGISPAKVLTGLGIGSVALGFAFKDIVENFLAGVLILWKFPFDPGDFIVCGDIDGTVEEVTIRMTEVRRTNGELVVLPNAKLFKEPVVVRTSKSVRRMTIPAGVAYEADVDEARRVITEAVEACETVDNDHPIEVFVDGLGASSVDFAVTWWCGAMPLEERASRDEVVGAVKKALDAAGIEIPWPQQVVSFKGPVAVDRDPKEG